MPADPTASIAIDEIAAAERALYRAMIDLDYPALQRVLSPDLVYIHSTGVSESKERYLAALGEGLYEYETIESRNPRYHVERDTVIVDGLVDMLVGARRRPKDLIHLYFILVWIRREGRWLLQYRQATRIP